MKTPHIHSGAGYKLWTLKVPRFKITYPKAIPSANRGPPAIITPVPISGWNCTLCMITFINQRSCWLPLIESALKQMMYWHVTWFGWVRDIIPLLWWRGKEMNQWEGDATCSLLNWFQMTSIWSSSIAPWSGLWDPHVINNIQISLGEIRAFRSVWICPALPHKWFNESDKLYEVLVIFISQQNLSSAHN